jgi:tetratricopeptide (TPR) repeat protein
MPHKDQVFLSYAHDDLSKVREMYDGLQKRGLNIWFDQVSLAPGPWRSQITKAIASSRYYVIALSNAALRKTGQDPGFLDEELDTAYQFAKDLPVKEFTIVPVLLEDCDRGDHRLKSFQQYALYEGWEAHLDALALAIGGHKLANIEEKDERSGDEKLIAGLKSRAETFHYAADYERAIRLWDTVLALEGDSVIPWHNKGNAFRRLGWYDEALNAYDKALSLDPKHLDTWYNKGNVLDDLSRYDEALPCYDRALTINPNDLGVMKRRQMILDKRNSAE